MGITIPHTRLTNKQTIKLFSNPVCGIICKYQLPLATQALTKGGILEDIKTIKYSKSMVINALEFWRKQALLYYQRIKRINDPLSPQTLDFSRLENRVRDLGTIKQTIIKYCPDHFLFSHRYIQTFKKDKENQGLKIQRKLLEQKYPKIGKIWFQNGTLAPLACIRDNNTDIEFTIFLNEHPTLQRSKIAEVGETAKGNIFIIKK